MAVSPYIWGRPKLDISFEVKTVNQCEVLYCLIQNIPIKSKMLDWLNIYRRQVDDLVVDFDISKWTDKGIQKISPLFRAKLKTQQGQEAERISLPASKFPAGFPVVAYDKIKGVAFTMGTMEADKDIWLKGGVFRIEIRINYGARVKTILKDFIIASSPRYIRLGEQNESEQ